MAETPNTDLYYKLAPDAIPQEGVPNGEIKGPFTLPSEVYPGTQHTYWIYVPAQYDPAVPASLMIYNDGQAFMAPEGDVRAQIVMDNLIYRREIPVMIGVFINPGRRPDQPEPTLKNWGDRDTNRPTEYNTLDDKYARVIVDELLPVLYKDYNISKDPERHGIGGSSSGAIAAFTVAWERPNYFRKVLSNVGSFTNIRGGNAYPDIIRKSEKKPLRVFLVDGRNDNRGLRGRRKLRSDARLVLSECADAAGAHRKGLRRELLMGHPAPWSEDAADGVPGDDALAVARSRCFDRCTRYGRAIVQRAQETIAPAVSPSDAEERMDVRRQRITPPLFQSFGRWRRKFFSDLLHRRISAAAAVGISPETCPISRSSR